MHAATATEPIRASERGALVSHLLSHLARTARAMRLARQLSGACAPAMMGLTMSGVVPVLRDEQEMLRALLLTLADPDERSWTADESRSVRAMVAAAEQQIEPWNSNVERREAGAPVADALLDAMIEGCWGRRALWRALAERSRRTAPHQAVDFAALARRSEAMIGELEMLQHEVSVAR